MKKILMVMMFAVATATSAKAQLFIGGSLGFDYMASSETAGSTTVNGPALTYIDVSPMAGFYLSDKFAVGARGSFGMGITNYRQDGDKSTKYSSSKWGVEPFARLSVVNVGEFSLFLEGGVPFSGVSTEATQGSTTKKGYSVSEFGVRILPILSYELTDNLSLEMRPNLLRLGFSMATVTHPDNDDYKQSVTNFGFGVNSSAIRSSVNKALLLDDAVYDFGNCDLFAALPLLEIGIVFKF